MYSVLVFSTFLACSTGSGFFTVELLSYSNPKGEELSGSCCGSVDSSSCPPCPTYFHVCLRESQATGTGAGRRGACMLGEHVSSIMADRKLAPETPATNRTLRIPFEFAWTQAFTLVLEARHRSARGIVTSVEQSKHSGLLLPGGEWHTVTYTGPAAAITYRVRVTCSEHYYGAACTRFCQPRHDSHGHYTCTAHTGDKLCMPGWIGANCETPICREGYVTMYLSSFRKQCYIHLV
jgi:jagged-like protein